MAEHDGGGERAEMAPGGSGPVTRLSLPETSGTVPEIAAATGPSSAQPMVAGEPRAAPARDAPGRAEGDAAPHVPDSLAKRGASDEPALPAASSPGAAAGPARLPASSGDPSAAAGASNNVGDSGLQGQAELAPRQVLGAIGLGLAIALVGIGGFLLGLTHVFEQGERVHLEIDPAALDLGEVWAQTGLEVRLPVRNIGMRPVTVFDVRTTGCVCTSATPRQFEVTPGAERVVKLVLDLARGDALAPGDRLPEEFSMDVSLIPADRLALPRVFKIGGRIRRAFRPSPSRLVFGGANRPTKGMSGPVQHVEIEPLQKLVAFRVTAPEHLRCQVTRHSRKWRLSVEPLPSLPPGKFLCTLSLAAQLESGETLPPYDLSVQGTCVPDLEILPAALHLGIVQPGERRQADILVRSVRRRPLALDEAVCDDPAVELVSCPSSDGALALMVHFTGGEPRLARATLRLQIRAGQGGAEQLVLPITACVAAPPDASSWNSVP
ncbi:MAG: DUF1573 domain-containing protein [Pirellulales bacterium]|nr:DUF1573 domain-containing protein [Pirellulales bacterium]